MHHHTDEMVFIAVLVTAVLLIFVARIDVVALKVIIDLAIAYWMIRNGRRRGAPGSTTPTSQNPA